MNLTLLYPTIAAFLGLRTRYWLIIIVVIIVVLAIAYFARRNAP